jgi:hypothetical protein
MIQILCKLQAKPFFLNESSWVLCVSISLNGVLCSKSKH